MAVRSGAGTGVVVSLVVFVLTTVFLLVLTIVFYAGQVKEREARAASDSALAVYVQARQRNSDFIQSLESAAKSRNQSVTSFLVGEKEDLLRFVDGDASTTLPQLKTKMSRFGVGDDGIVRDVLADRDRDVRSLQNEVESLKRQLGDQDSLLAEKDAMLDQAKQSHANELGAVRTEFEGYKQAGIEYRTELDETINDFERAKDQYRNDYGARISELEAENEELSRDSVVLRGRVNELESIIQSNRTRSIDPAQLVDGRVLDAAGPRGDIFIDRGKVDRIVLGITFEVYDDPASIRVNERTGELPRGKASLQVIKVGETTSTCKITRSVPGRPVVRDDVIANAVYDPTYQFKFLVHGKFDIDNDGRVSEAEAEYLRSLVLDWGGVVVTGEELPGDLDFLVLGKRPPDPGILPGNATEVQINEWVRKRRAREKYDQLFEQAREAQIPVLNDNRFLILIGHTDR